MRLFLVLSLLFSNLAFSAIRGKSLNRSIELISKDIRKVEKRIIKNSKKVQSINENIDLHYSKLEELDKEENDINSELSNLENDLKQFSYRIVLYSMNAQKDIESLAINSALLKKYNIQKSIMNEIKSKLNGTRAELAEIKNTIRELSDKEIEVENLIQQLEFEKNVLAKKYLKRSHKKVVRKRKNKKLKNRLGLNSNFISPVGEYSKTSSKGKGITYNFKKVLPVNATKSGKIIHNGTLGAYGRVIMIDHGNGDVSVLLGDFEAKVKKGQKVKVGSIVGYTKLNDFSQGKIYFELRKNNKVQNTIKYVSDLRKNKGKV